MSEKDEAWLAEVIRRIKKIHKKAKHEADSEAAMIVRRIHQETKKLNDDLDD